MMSLAWCELPLEAAGAFFFFRRKLPIWSWLGFRATADLICTSANLYSFKAYLWADYLQRTAQYVLFAAVCIYVAGRILRETQKTQCLYVWLLCALMALGIAHVHSVWPVTGRTVLSLEVWAELLLAALVAFALGMANGKAPRPWGLIGCALVVMGGSDGLITLLRQYGWQAEAWYPLGALLGLGMLCWAGWRDYRLDEFRVPLGKKKPPTSVAYHFKQAKEM